uniref:Rho-GAP domain-containing protein n=1 Tax=Arcella intermedia TaxID=1963864 RepID=A0A6B2KZP8_9EUKA
MKSSAIFAKPLSELMRESGDLTVPLIVYKCIQYLIPKYLQEEGIFRKNGKHNTIQFLKDAIDSGNVCYDRLFKYVDECHDVSGLLKLFIRELPEPVIGEKVQSQLLSIIVDPSLKDNTKTKISLIKSIFETQPYINEFQLLSYLCNMLNEVGSHNEHNKMTPSNLARVWAPNLIWEFDPPKDPNLLIEKNELHTNLVEFLILESRSLFENFKHPNISEPSVDPLPSESLLNDTADPIVIVYKDPEESTELPDMIEFSNKDATTKDYRRSMPLLKNLFGKPFHFLDMDRVEDNTRPATERIDLHMSTNHSNISLSASGGPRMSNDGEYTKRKESKEYKELKESRELKESKEPKEGEEDKKSKLIRAASSKNCGKKDKKDRKRTNSIKEIGKMNLIKRSEAAPPIHPPILSTLPNTIPSDIPDCEPPPQAVRSLSRRALTAPRPCEHRLSREDLLLQSKKADLVVGSSDSSLVTDESLLEDLPCIAIEFPANEKASKKSMDEENIENHRDSKSNKSFTMRSESRSEKKNVTLVYHSDICTHTSEIIKFFNTNDIAFTYQKFTDPITVEDGVKIIKNYKNILVIDEATDTIKYQGAIAELSTPRLKSLIAKEPNSNNFYNQQYMTEPCLLLKRDSLVVTSFSKLVFMKTIIPKLMEQN